MQHRIWIAVMTMLILLAGCTSREEELAQAIAQQSQTVGVRLTELRSAMDSGALKNTRLLRQYGQVVKQKKPALTGLVDAVMGAGSAQGTPFRDLENRFSTATTHPQSFTGKEMQLLELEQLYEAASPDRFNDLLSDSVNVLADLSDGELPRVSAISRHAEQSASRGEDYGQGSQFVGNPHYGQWQTHSSGTSIWAWYGAYSLFRNLLAPPIYYNRWASGRPYSYYHDYGRSRYTSPSQYQQQEQLQRRTKQRAESQGRRFNSPYARQRSGASGLSRASKTAFAAKSPYLKSSGGSLFGTGSTRDGGSKTSRGTVLGK